MSPSDKKAANAVSGKTARACDSCMRRRARWYCAADDAFLCQACDSSVHSANSLARRHQRVRLKTASLKPCDHEEPNSLGESFGGGGGGGGGIPAWHRGVRRKARTPRPGKPKAEQLMMLAMNQLPLVPEIGSDDQVPNDENEEHELLYRVPVFDAFVAELCKSETPPSEGGLISNDYGGGGAIVGLDNMRFASKDVLAEHDENNCGHELENLHGLLPSDMELAEFAADVESLLGRGLDEDSFGMEGLGLLDAQDGGTYNQEYQFRLSTNGMVKIEEDDEDNKEDDEGMNNKVRSSSSIKCARQLDSEMKTSRSETLELDFDCETPTTGGEDEVHEEKVGVGDGDARTKTMVVMMKKKNKNGNNDHQEATIKKKKRKISLRLDYDAVIAAWASEGSPWTTGDRPEFNLDDHCWIENIGTWGTEFHHQGYGGGGEMGCNGHVGLLGDGGREARVSRYREKRRTRLFSKKIRYEVRKLNAEKRPRMKGRFVKRASFVGVGHGFSF
ncbi:hypothetical protein Sjap_024442 [Stephania japonica]|uniref:Uncharacterized protein n=1 Tax=Stephania japonica TaxID=461633 RepID=A0AAP0EFK2_9MAGN